MRILLVTGEYPPLIGGVGAYTAELARALVDLGAQVEVVTSTRAHADGSSAIPVHATVTRWSPLSMRNIARLADQLGADWVHVQYQTAAYGMNPAINFAPEYWRRRGNRTWRIAWSYHDLRIPYLFPKAGDRLRESVTLRPALHSDLVIVTNEEDRLQIAERIPNLHSIPIGSNIAGLRLTDEERSRVRERFGYANSVPLLGYFGFLNRSKGGITLIETLDLLVRAGLDAHLLMIGDPLGASDPANRAYLAEVQQAIEARGLGARIRWTGSAADRDVAEALNAIDVLLLPYEDGASLRRGTLMAAMANGCPLVTTTPTTPIPELVDGRDLVFVPASNARAASEAVRSLLEEPARRRAMGESLRARNAGFTWAAIAHRHMALYAAAA